MWLKNEVDDSILEEVNRRLREYIITQMLNFLRFILAVNEIEDSGTKTFDEVCADERDEFIKPTTFEIENEYYHDDYFEDDYFEDEYDTEKYIPNFKYLWDIIFNKFGQFNKQPYTPILSAYCRSNNITAKQTLYIQMAAELETWVDTITQFDDIVIIAIGMVRNIDICSIFEEYLRISHKHGPIKLLFYENILSILIENNFENIDQYSFKIQPLKPIKQKYDDPLQQVFVKFINSKVDGPHKNPTAIYTKETICKNISDIIYDMFDIIIPILPTDANTEFDDIDQIIEYCELKIPQYPAEIKRNLSILQVIEVSIYDDVFTNLAKMAELSNYNLTNLPIGPMIYGFCGATPLNAIPLEDIPEYYERLTQRYSGTHTKVAKRDIQLNI